jgi:hypothetical protein
LTYPLVGTDRQTLFILEPGDKKAGRIAIVDKVLSLLISAGIITFGAWVVVITIAKGSPLGWTLMALFPLLTGFISLSGSR